MSDNLTLTLHENLALGLSIILFIFFELCPKTIICPVQADATLLFFSGGQSS